MGKLKTFIGVLILITSVLGGYEKTYAKTPKVKPLILAHRGASDVAPEETIPAFKIAVQDKVNYIEMDLRMTKDKQLVLMHDTTVNRTTNGKGNVSSFTLSQIKKLDAGSKFSKKYKNTRVATLQEVLDTLGSKTKYYIETRLENNKLQQEEPLVKLLNKKGLIKQHRVIVESFSESSLKKIRSLNKNIPLVQLTMYKNDSSFTTAKIKDWKSYAFGVGMDSSLVNKTLVSKLHGNNLKMHVFFLTTSKEKAEQKRVISDGVDGVFTNHITYTQSLLK